MLLGATCFGADTAFWKPYEHDAATFLLESFDTEGAPAGRFGGAHRGPAAQVQVEPRLLLKGQISLECWVKLDNLPEERAYLIRRFHEAGRTRGFELFVDPSGAFGVAVQNCLGTRSELRSDEARVTVGEWAHLAAISISTTYGVLYLDGKEVARVPLQGGQGLAADKKKEAVPAPVIIGDGVPGLLDEVRVHTNISKLWPRPQQPWIAARAGVKLPAITTVLAPGHEPVLHLPFDGNRVALVNTTAVTVKVGGAYVEGVRGQAFRGNVELLGKMASAEEGAIEFWCRPLGINNYSDQNVILFNNSLFTFYLFNTTRFFRPLTLYYRDREKKIHFAGDKLATEVYPGKWDHYLVTWGSGKVQWYVNGQQAGGAGAAFTATDLTSVKFSPHQLFGDIDELYVYDQALSPVETANAYWRYVDPTKVKESPRARLADLRFWHLPSSRDLYVQIRALDAKTAQLPLQIQLKDAKDEVVFSAPAAFSADYQRFILPELESGEYSLNLKLPRAETEPQMLKRQRFAWEGHQLGMTDEVFPPFTPVVTEGREVSVVLRQHRMNEFGLWDSVKAKGREILAAPLRFTAQDENGHRLPWQGNVERVSARPHLAAYRAVSACAALKLATTSEMQMDGMMKITARMSPVPDATRLRRLSLEIPLKEEVATLLHESTDIIRAGYAGAMPAGEGEIWNSKQSFRQPSWLNAFTGYIWMGGPERGLAWFAENDRGWITAKNHDAPLMHIVRAKGRVTLRIDLINISGIIDQPTEMVFGLQASPTRPAPADYRTKARTLPSVGLPVHPWGGLSCSWKSPWMDKWEVVDKVIEGRNTGKVDRAFFESFQTQYNVPKIHGVKSWVADVCYFASRTKPLTSPDPVYFEEMAALPFIPEYHVFQDEWSRTRLAEKNYASVDIYRTSGGREINPDAPVNYCRSYQDYGLAQMNEWMKRGVSMYWDNTYLRSSTNPWTSAAYRTKDGRIQPASTLWNQRQYMQRTWNLMNHWRRQGVPRPLEFVAHMTNTNLLPLFSWSTCNYDIEMSQSVYANAFPDTYQPGEPYTPEFLLAESTGLQVGAYPYLVHSIFAGQCKLPDEALGPAPGQVEVGRREWGMRMVHEIISGGPQYYRLPTGTLNKAIYEFGYGADAVDVWNYWDDTPAFTVEDDHVKGLLLTRKSDRKMLLVLQSWSKEPVTTTVALRPTVIGFAPGSHVYDAFRNAHAQLTGKELLVSFDFPYETAIYLIDEQATPADVLFADDFEHGLNPGWDYIPNYAATENGALRLAENRASWRGNPRILKWLALPDFTDAELSFTFRIGKLPTARAEVLSVRFPANGVAWSKHGLTHSYVNKGGPLVQVVADPARGFVWRANIERGRRAVRLGESLAGPVNAGHHRVQIAVSGGRCTVAVDGETVIATDEVPPTMGNAFGISASRDPAKDIGALYLDDIVLRAAKTDRARLDRERTRAQARTTEILAGQTNELKQMITRVFGVRRAPPLYKLALFRNPEADAAELAQRFLGTTNASQRQALLALLTELPKREKEHVTSMTAIGQPADRLPQFEAARAYAMKFLQAQSSDANETTRVAITEALKVLDSAK